MELGIIIVYYRNPVEDVAALLESINQSSYRSHSLYLFDNGGFDEIKNQLPAIPLALFSEDKNVGYSKAINHILKKTKGQHEFYLVVNPDVTFGKTCLHQAIQYLRRNQQVGQLHPKVLNPDDTIQFTYKSKPLPTDLFFRRFLSQAMMQRNKQLSRKSDSEKIITVPFMTGCFMLFKNEVLNSVGLFDERFFLYMEDLDFSLRVSEKYESHYVPKIVIKHRHNQGSYNQLFLLYQHIISAIKYFNKHGWRP